MGKDQQIAGGLIFAFGMVGGVVAASMGNGTFGSLLFLVGVCGLGVFIYGRFKHWYHAE